MTAAQFLAKLQKGLPPAALLLGPEAYDRRRIKDAMLAAFPEAAVTRHDLAETDLAAILDDARSLSLFAADRLIWISNAEAALPRVRSDSEEAEDGGSGGGSGAGALLPAYLKDPTPGVALVLEAARYDFEGDDKRKQERVRKFYAEIPEVVELRRYTARDARSAAEALAKSAKLRLEPEALDLLVEALGADVARISVEIEKLALFAGGRPVSADDIAALAPEARVTTIFALVNALGRRDRTRALEILDTLTREGEYLPLALAFLSTQFRLALAAREAGLKTAQQIQGHFTRMGLPMWSSRADQVQQTVTKFGKPQMERALRLIFEADKGLRDARPDDRVVMEQFVLKLTA